MAMCETPGCQEHYGCRLKGKGIQLSNSVTSSRTKNMRPSVTPPDTSRAEILYDERPGGTKIPLIGADGGVIRRGRRTRAQVDAVVKKHRTQSLP